MHEPLRQTGVEDGVRLTSSEVRLLLQAGAAGRDNKD